MTNPIDKLIETILINTDSDPNLKNELLNDLTEETKHYYDILHTRAEQGQPVEELELEMLTEKFVKTFRHTVSSSQVNLIRASAQNH